MATSAKAPKTDELYQIHVEDGTVIMARRWLKAVTGTGRCSVMYYPPVGNPSHVLQENIIKIVFMETNEVVFSPEMEKAREKEERRKARSLLKKQAKVLRNEKRAAKEAKAAAKVAAAAAASAAAAAAAASAAAASAAAESEEEEEEA
jgi:hypothetical protein